jgi:hypothetical protein
LILVAPASPHEAVTFGANLQPGIEAEAPEETDSIADLVAGTESTADKVSSTVTLANLTVYSSIANGHDHHNEPSGAEVLLPSPGPAPVITTTAKQHHCDHIDTTPSTSYAAAQEGGTGSGQSSSQEAAGSRGSGAGSVTQRSSTQLALPGGLAVTTLSLSPARGSGLLRLGTAGGSPKQGLGFRRTGSGDESPRLGVARLGLGSGDVSPRTDYRALQERALAMAAAASARAAEVTQQQGANSPQQVDEQ